MKKKKSLIEPNPIEKDLQKEFSAIISTLPTQERIKKMTPRIKKIKSKIEKKRKSKATLRRLMRE